MKYAKLLFIMFFIFHSVEIMPMGIEAAERWFAQNRNNILQTIPRLSEELQQRFLDGRYNDDDLDLVQRLSIRYGFPITDPPENANEFTIQRLIRDEITRILEEQQAPQAQLHRPAAHHQQVQPIQRQQPNADQTTAWFNHNRHRFVELVRAAIQERRHFAVPDAALNLFWHEPNFQQIINLPFINRDILKAHFRAMFNQLEQEQQAPQAQPHRPAAHHQQALPIQRQQPNADQTTAWFHHNRHHFVELVRAAIQARRHFAVPDAALNLFWHEPDFQRIINRPYINRDILKAHFRAMFNQLEREQQAQLEQPQRPAKDHLIQRPQLQQPIQREIHPPQDPVLNALQLAILL